MTSTDSSWLSPGQVAARFGVSVDAVRKWGETGRLPEYRTPGGHRRFRAQDVEALAAGKPPRPAPQQAQRRQALTAFDPREPDDDEGVDDARTEGRMLPPPWDSRAREARAGVEVLAHQARDELAEATRRKRDDESREAAAAAAEEAEARRLKSLKDHGRSRASWSFVPTVWQARVGQVLERYVTSERFPAGLQNSEAKALVEEKVEDVLRPYREAQEDEQCLRRLTTRGKSLASTRTLSWDWTARNEARQAVKEALEQELEPDWTETDVEDLVEEVLEEWDSQDEEN